MAVSLTSDEGYRVLREPGRLNGRSFALMGTIAGLASEESTADEARDLLIRALARQDDLDDDCRPILKSLTAQLGLFPYLKDPDDLYLDEQLVLEYHRPRAAPFEEFVFHGPQRRIFQRLISGRNTILSAPTSFGKSAIIDALVLSQRWQTIVMIVPTLALIDETRRRLTRLPSGYKVVTSPGQPPAERTLYVLTQERFLDLPATPPVDLFIIDEFYKLDSSEEQTRSSLLNIAFDRLLRTGAQYYLIGPNIDRLADQLPANVREALVVESFRTVAVDEHRIADVEDEKSALVEVAAQVQGPTLIYVRSPARARQVGDWLLEAGIGSEDGRASRAAEWVADNFGPAWSVARCLRGGVGIHHGQMPRALQHHILRHFNAGELRYLVCTSTLIEGVNSVAENVLILDTRRNKRLIDYFTYNNIRGRAGRMFQHFVGQVFIFDTEPARQETLVDMPILSQSEKVSNAALMSLKPDQLTSESQSRLSQFLSDDLLSPETLRANSGIDPARQLAVAREIFEQSAYYYPLLAWSGVPTWEQRKAAADLILRFLFEGQRGQVSAASLALRIDLIRRFGANIPLLAQEQVDFFKGDLDAATENVLWFLRNWASFSFPAMLSALDRIQREVFGRMGAPPGSYGFYASQVESLFLPPFTVEMEEYGLPFQVALKLIRGGAITGATIDEVLDSVARTNQRTPVLAGLTPYEDEMLADVRTGLGIR